MKKELEKQIEEYTDEFINVFCGGEKERATQLFKLNEIHENNLVTVFFSHCGTPVNYPVLHISPREDHIAISYTDMIKELFRKKVSFRLSNF